MDTETTEDVIIDANNDGEGNEMTTETVSIPKKDYDVLNQTLGSLKREIKDLKKSKDDTKETHQTKPEEMSLLQKSYLRAAGISDAEEVELALSTAKKWGIEVDKLVDDDDFQAKLDKHRTLKANALATSNIKGGEGATQAKNTEAYWVAKGVPPSRTDVPDRGTRAKIARALLANAKTSKTFYNE